MPKAYRTHYICCSLWKIIQILGILCYAICCKVILMLFYLARELRIICLPSSTRSSILEPQLVFKLLMENFPFTLGRSHLNFHRLTVTVSYQEIPHHTQLTYLQRLFLGISLEDGETRYPILSKCHQLLILWL